MTKSAVNKQANKQILLDRLESALTDLYHNATPNYPQTQNEYEASLFDDWFTNAASFEIEYIQDGGAYSVMTYQDYAASAARDGKSPAYAHYYARKCIKTCNLERAKYAPWEWVGSKFGKIYTYGRGGRTLAPEQCIRTRGGSGFSIMSIDDFSDERGKEWLTQAIQILESFNSYVAAWCKSIPDQWNEYKAENDLQADIEDHDGMRPYQQTAWR